jgi:hypothetical protein
MEVLSANHRPAPELEDPGAPRPPVNLLAGRRIPVTSSPISTGSPRCTKVYLPSRSLLNSAIFLIVYDTSAFFHGKKWKKPFASASSSLNP